MASFIGKVNHQLSLIIKLAKAGFIKTVTVNQPQQQFFHFHILHYIIPQNICYKSSWRSWFQFVCELHLPAVTPPSACI